MVVWRRGGASSQDTEMPGTQATSGEPQIVTIVPLEEYSHPIPFRKDELEELQNSGFY